jgi:hypothetical protein
MKTTIDLPESLALKLKITAARRGKIIKSLAAESFRVAMQAASSAPPAASRGKITLPLFPCAADAPARHMPIGQLLALEQESQTEEDLARLGLSL